LIVGGVSAWQLWAVPVLLLATGRLAMWPWAAGRLESGKPALLLWCCGLLAVAWVAGSLWYRVLQVPDAGEPFDVRAYAAALPPPEQNKAGGLIRQASQYLPGLARWRLEQAETTLGGAEPRVDRALGQWLDEVFEGEWANELRKAATLSLGTVEDPRKENYSRLSSPPEGVRAAVGFLRVRALQLQRRGEDGAALDQLVVALAVVRNLRNHATAPWYAAALDLEGRTLQTFGLWLDRLGRRPRLLRRALDELTRHEAQLPPFSDHLKADYLLVIHTLNTPASMARYETKASAGELVAQSQLAVWARQVPWEQERVTRIIDAVYGGWLMSAATDFWEVTKLVAADAADSNQSGFVLRGWLPPPGVTCTAARLSRLVNETVVLPIILPDEWALRRAKVNLLLQIRATRLKLAEALYQAEKGKASQSVEDLVPRYLPAPLIDPVTGLVIPLAYWPKPGAQRRMASAR
jgi:hypothetical protein